MPNHHHIISGSSVACRLMSSVDRSKADKSNKMSRIQLVKSPSAAIRMGQKSALIILIVLLSANGLGAIVNKQQQARSDDSSVSVQQQQQQQTSASASSGSAGAIGVASSNNANSNNGPVSYNPSAASSGAPSGSNHQTSGSARSQSQSQSAASADSSQQSSLMSGGGYSGAPNKQSNYQNYGADQMMASASSPEQSYQAAAQSVNMALANSGIFGSSGSGSSQTQQQQQQASNYNNPSALNPLHYFYYPGPKETGASSGAPSSSASSSGAQLAPSKPMDLMAAAGTNQYASASSPTGSYSDQYQNQPLMQSYGGQMGSPDMAASSQDTSYLPQPQQQQQQQQQQAQQQPQHQLDQAQQGSPQQSGQNQMYMQNGGSQQGQYGQQQAGGPQQQQQGDSYQAVPSASQSSSISFNGPSAAGAQSMGASESAFMNSHLNGHQQAQFGAQNGNQNVNSNGNFYNQLGASGDLSTSNYGNMASSGIGSIASYMAPPSQAHQHDSLFGGGQSSAAFNSAASQLSPAAIAPPSSQQQQQQQQQSQQASSSLFSAASSLFGSQQQPNNNANNNYFANQHYLSSYLTPQQYTQLTGQQIGDLTGQQPSLYGNGPQGLGMAGSSTIGSALPAPQAGSGGPIGGAASSSKRFGLSSLVMPVLALAGLSLLIPTMSNIGTAVGRRKRSIVEEKASASTRQQQLINEPHEGIAHQLAKESAIGEYLDKLQRYYSIYQNAVENDDCMNRLICEFGDAVKDVTGNGAMIHVAESLAPSWMKIGGEKMQVFKEAASSRASSKDKCKKYSCQRGSGGSGSRQH